MLLSLLSQPYLAGSISAEEWSKVLMAARQTQLLGQLGASLRRAGEYDRLHSRLQRALDLERLSTTRRGEAAQWEIGVIRRVIPMSIPIILLKGSAYLVAGDANADGRMFSDIDIMVPHDALDSAEAALMTAGWKPSPVDAYDQKYYREWMHEIPPMEHVRRGTNVDLHHAIIPKVSRYAFPAQQLFDNSQEAAPGVFVLAPVDRLLHAVVHSLIEGLPGKALRDLYDIYLLKRQHFPEPGNLEPLITRANTLGLTPLLDTALRASDALFAGKPAPSVMTRAGLLAIAARSSIENGKFADSLAQQWLLAHSHWMKMPLSMLSRHLAHKAWNELGTKRLAKKPQTQS